MQREKFFSKKLVVCFLMIMALFAVIKTDRVQAASISYNKAVGLYNKTVMNNWAKNSKKLTVTDDLCTTGGWSTAFSKKGKKVSLKPLYTSDSVRYIFRDFNGDGTREALFGVDGYIFLFTIQKNQVKAVATFYVGEAQYAQVFYNSKKKTFSISFLVTARSLSAGVYRLNKSKLTKVMTLGDYIEPANSSGTSKYNCWKNKTRVSASKFKSYKKTYLNEKMKLGWGP